VGLLGAPGVGFDGTDQGVCQLRGPKFLVGIGAGVEADDHPEPGRRRYQLVQRDHLTRPLSRRAVRLACS